MAGRSLPRRHVESIGSAKGEPLGRESDAMATTQKSLLLVPTCTGRRMQQFTEVST